jgi:hypothetical protein
MTRAQVLWRVGWVVLLVLAATITYIVLVVVGR